MFYGCDSLTSIDLSGWNTSLMNEYSAWGMFEGCSQLSTIILGNNFTTLANTYIPAPSNDSPYTGLWTNGSVTKTSGELMALTQPALAGAWYWEGGTPPAQPTPAPSGNTITVNKTINVPASVDLTGLTYTFDFQAAAPVANEEGAFAVPTITAAQAAEQGFDSTNQAAGSQVDIPTVTLTAANSTLTTGNDSVRTISGTVNLPDPNLFGHAGVYAYTVTETVTGANANDSWDNDLSQYKVRLYVINDGQGGLVYDDATTNGGADTMMIEVLKDIDGNNAGSAGSSVQAGAKVNALDFTNTYDKTVPFQVKKIVSGDYANRTHRFSFDLTLDFPDYVTSGTYAYTTSYGGSGTVTVANGQATISGFQLAADETLDFASLPVGTVYTVVESTPSEGVNDYVPSATYTYSGIGAANSGYETATNSVSAGTAGATYTVNRTNGADQNLNTILGAGSGNRVDVTNTLDNPPSSTGVLVQTLPFVAIFAIPAILAAALYITRRRDEEDRL